MLKKYKFLFISFSSLLAISALIYLFLNRPVPITGDELEKTMNETAWNSASRWWLVKADSENYVLKYEYHPLKSDNYLVSRNQIAFPPSIELKKLPVIIHSGDITLRAGRSPGAEERQLTITSVGPNAKKNK